MPGNARLENAPAKTTSTSITTTRKTVPAYSAARAAEGGRRGASASAVLRTVLDHGPVARSTIARITGLSPASVTGHSAELAKLGLIYELPEQVQSNGVGRPHLPVDVDTTHHLAGAIHIAVPSITTALVDLRGRILRQDRELHTDTDPVRVAQCAADSFARLLSAHDSEAVPLGLGVATGGWVDRVSGVVVDHPLLGWRDVPLRQLLSDRTGLPVHVDGHSRALLHAERLFGQARQGGSVLHLFIGNVVDAAFATHELTHYGPRSQAGAIAHLPMAGSREPCPCRRIGCLQAAVSEQTLARQAFDAGVIATPDFASLLTIAREGSPAAGHLFVERARLVGQAAAMLIDVLNPELIVVMEPGVMFLPDALAALREEISIQSSTAVDAAKAVVPSSFPDALLATAGGAVILDALYRDPLGLLAA